MSDPIPIPNSLPIAEESAVEMFRQNTVKEKLAKNINSFFIYSFYHSHFLLNILFILVASL